MKRQASTNTQNLMVEIHSLLAKAEQEKATNLGEAIETLQHAGSLIPKLNTDHHNNKQSVRNATENKATQEILYFSKQGNILYELQEYQRAGESYLEVMKRIPSNNKVYKAYGDALRKQGKYSEAIKQYADGLAIYDEEDSPSVNNKAALLNSQGLAQVGLKQYEEAIKSFNEALKIENNKNALYHCNLGQAYYAKGDKEEALKSFNEARTLTASSQLAEGLTKDNIGYINKTLEEFIAQVKDLEKIQLAKANKIINDREANFVKEAVNSLTLSNIEGADLAAVRATEVKQILDTKGRLSIIEDDIQLNGYYEGFIFTVTQSYDTARIVNSDALRLNTSNKLVTGTTTLISFIPLIGDKISTVINTAWEFAKEAQMQKAASNVCKFAPTSGKFEEITQDIITEILTSRQQEIKDLKVESYILPKWVAQFKGVIDRLNESLYGEVHDTAIKKAGHQTAALIVKAVASGEIYAGKTAGEMLPKEKKLALSEVAYKLIEQDIEASNKKLVFKEVSSPIKLNEQQIKVSDETKQQVKVSNETEQKAHLADKAQQGFKADDNKLVSEDISRQVKATDQKTNTLGKDASGSNPNTDKSAANNKTHCCEIFSVTKIVYDNPLLNDSKLFNTVGKTLGFSNALQASDTLIKLGLSELLTEAMSETRLDNCGGGTELLKALLLGSHDSNYNEYQG